MSLELVFSDSDKGWTVVFENEAKNITTITSAGSIGIAQVLVITAVLQQFTTTTHSNFKIHTFTADSNFVVSNGWLVMLQIRCLMS